VEVLDDTAAGIREGISSTPTTVVNGQRFTGVPDMATFLAAIDAAAAGASPVPAPTPQPTQHAWSGVRTDGLEAGDPAAPLTMELWMDYQSPDASVVADALGPELRSRIQAGEVRAELRDLALLGDESVAAGSFVACVAAQDGPTWLVHDVLASAGRGADSGLFTTSNLLRFGSQLGLDVRALNACLEDEAVADGVRQETAAGTGAGLRDAPVVVVRRGETELGRFAAPLDVPAIIAVLDEAG
jgi:protein-disulfide isomerase